MWLTFLLGCQPAPPPTPGRPPRPIAAPTIAFTEIELAGSWSAVTDFAFLPGSSELFVLDRDGSIGHLSLADNHTELLGEFQVPGVYVAADCGLMSLVPAPDFATTRHLYVGLCVDAKTSKVMRLTVPPNAYDTVADSAVDILTAGDDDAYVGWHNVGAMGFEPSGTLWVLLGDKYVANNGQDASTNLGGLVRIRPGHDGGYGHAPDNPWPDHPTASPDLYAVGLRSPWRGQLDSRGRLWIGDVGASKVEEINVVTRPGENFGWPLHEGPCLGNCDGMTDPVLSWTHRVDERYVLGDARASPTSRRVAWIGPEYRPPPGLDRYRRTLTGRHLFGDTCAGFVRAVELDAGGHILLDRHAGHLDDLVAMAMAPDGYLYAASLGACADLDALTEPPVSRLWRVIPVLPAQPRPRPRAR